MSESLPLRIFMASPGDVADERQVIATCVDERNERRRGQSNVVFEVVGWEQVRGTARRPQEAINELIAESHFLIAIFKQRWGSEPGSPWGYTSGTEEELFTGLLELAQVEQPMRDIWVAFMAHPEPDERVLRLKDQMGTSHSMLYESASDLRDLKSKLTERLDGWENAQSRKQARHIDLMSSTGKEVLRAAYLRASGEKLVELGQVETGGAKIREASVIGGPAEKLAYARHLARQGDLDGAGRMAQIAIDQCLEYGSGLYTTLAAETHAAHAGVLRRAGKTLEAVGRLEQALTLLSGEDQYAQSVRSRILDELGIARLSLGQFDEAKRTFEQGLLTRQLFARASEIAQSHVNLARASVSLRDLRAAREHAESANQALADVPPTDLHANAAVLTAQVALREGAAHEGIPHAERALALNRQFGNQRGVAIALLLLAQMCRAVDEDLQASVYASECLEVNIRMNNQHGMDKARWILNQLGSRDA